MNVEILLRQAVPPLLLLPLLALSFDAGGLMLWLFGAGAALVSAGRVLMNLPLGAWKSAWSWESMLRPCLTLAIVAVAVVTANVRERRSAQAVVDLVAALQAACRSEDRCPAAPSGWAVAEKYARSEAGNWRLTYVTGAGGAEYGLWINKGRENELCIHGGKAMDVTEVKSIHCRSDEKVRSRAF
jgi:hypothetical protein